MLLYNKEFRILHAKNYQAFIILVFCFILQPEKDFITR